MKIRNFLPALCLITLALELDALKTFAQNWSQKVDFGGTGRAWAVGFSIGAKGYIGTGQDAANYYRDFWEWDQATNVWTQKSDFPGTARYGAVGFSIGAKGYIGTGAISNVSITKDFWEWDQAGNTWTKKSDFGGIARAYAVGFSIGSKGYIGTGWNAGIYQQDFWEWNQATDTWTKKSNVGGVPRVEAVGFSIGSKGYVGVGWDGFAWMKDFWEYTPATDTWTKKADFGGLAIFRATGFSIGNKGYIGTGSISPSPFLTRDFWEWNQATDTWTKKADFGGTKRGGAVGFSIGSCGYIGTGYDIPGVLFKQDFWEWGICSTTSLSNTATSTNILCNGECTGTGTANPSGGISPYTYNWSNGQSSQTSTGLCTGTYTVTVIDAATNTATATISITQPPPLTTTVTAANSVCGGSNGSASVNAGGGTPGYTYSWNPSGQTSQTATGLVAGNYTATITDANNCTTSQTVTVVSSGGSINTSQSASLCTGYTYTLPGGTVVSTGGAYIDTLTSSGGCDSIITTTLTVNPNPTATAFSNVTITQGQSVTFTASGGGTYSWYPSTGLSCTTCSNPTATASPLWGAGGLVYCVTVTDANNCTDTACVTVTLEPIDCSNAGELYLPNAFSPNNDGENDKLQIYYGNIKCIKTFNLAIYNRWGEKVFETTNPTAQWDGSYKGKIECTAVFVYYMEALLLSGEEIVKKGTTTLVQ